MDFVHNLIHSECETLPFSTIMEDIRAGKEIVVRSTS